MSQRRSLRGKEIAVDEVEVLPASLPERLFATDRFPCERINMYSTIDFLLCVRDALNGTEEMAMLLRSCFGSLFRLPVRRVLMGKVIHGMLTRQVLTKKKYELWSVFGGNPFRFSLVEFGEVTGLPCDEFEEGYSIDYELPATEENYAYWEKLIGPDRDATIGDLVAMVLGDTGMSGSRKLRLCLIIIVDGVLVPTSQIQKPSLKHVNLVKNIKNFFAFQWGRESFAWAIRTMKPGPKVMGKCEDPNGDFCKKLRQKTLRILGFPLALQLVAFELIPQLLKQARGDDSTTLLTFPGQVLPHHAGLTVVHLRKAESEAGLVVQPMMEISGTHDESWAAWDDEKYDKKVENMLGMIKSGYAFSKGDWGGGDPIYKHGVKVNAKKRKGAAHIGVTEAPILKQRRVSGYFRRGAMVDAEQYRRMEAHVQELVLEVQKLKNVVERQGRKFEKWKTFVKGKSSIKKQGSIKSRSKRRTLQGREGTEENHDGAEGMEPPCGAEVVIETEDKVVLLEDHVTVAGLGQVKKVDTETEEKVDKSERAGEKGEHLSVDEAGIAEEAEGAQGGDVIERERQDVLENVGAVCGQVEPNKVVVHAIEKEGKAEEKVENENDESDSQVEFCVHEGDSEDAEITGVGPNTTVLDVSDTSDGGGQQGMSQLNKKVNWRQCCWQRISTLHRTLSKLLKIVTTPTSN
ncbi:unnamed protein product [Brassica oleracea]